MNNDLGKINKTTLDAARRGDTDAVLESVSEEDRKKIESVLADQEKLRKILSSDAAQNLIKILGGKRNG